MVNLIMLTVAKSSLTISLMFYTSAYLEKDIKEKGSNNYPNAYLTHYGSRCPIEIVY